MDKKTELMQRLLLDYEGPLLRYVLKILKDHARAKDIVQEAFIRFLNKIPPPTSESCFLFRTAHNLCCDYLRSAKRRKEEFCEPESFRTIASSARSPLEEICADEDLTLMRRIFDTLDEKKKAIILLKLEQGLSYQQIGEIMGMTPSNIGATLCQTLKKIRQDLECQHIGEGGN